MAKKEPPQEYIEVLEVLNVLYDEVDGCSFYDYIFPDNQKQGEQCGHYEKPNAVYLYTDEKDNGTKRRLRRRIMLSDTWKEDYINYVEQNPSTLCSGIAYRGRANNLENAQRMYALAIDLDGVGLYELKNLLLRFGQPAENIRTLPVPTFLVMSGTGLHVYYVFEEPIDLFPNIKLQMKSLKYDLTFRMWDYKSTSKKDKVQYQSFDDISGFTFIDNVVNYPYTVTQRGFQNNTTLSDSIDLKPYMEKKNGASWYTLSENHELVLTGNEISVKAGQNTLLEALNQAQSGDILNLSEEGVYWLDNTLLIDKYIRIQADSHLSKRPVLCFNGMSGKAFVTIVNGGNLEIQGLAFNGEGEAGKALSEGGITVKSGTITPYLLTVDNCEFYNFNESGLAAIRGEKSTFSPMVIIRNSFFHDMSGEAINFAGEKDDKGKYNVEELHVDNCIFYRLLGSALNIYRGGNDESTSGPLLTVDHCTIENVDNKEQGSAMRLIGVQSATVTNCSFANSGKGGASIRFNEMSWDKLSVSYINLYNSGRIASFWGKLRSKNITNYRPEYVDANTGNFYQISTSPLSNKASDKKDLGIIQ